MRYVSKILNKYNEDCWYSSIENIKYVWVTDSDSHKVKKYNGVPIGNIYGVVFDTGVWRIHKSDFSLYKLLEFKESVKLYNTMNVIRVIETPFDKTQTLTKNYLRYSNTEDFMTLAAIIFKVLRSKDDISYQNIIQVNDNTLEFYPYHGSKTFIYDILDINKFNILITKVSVLGRV